MCVWGAATGAPSGDGSCQLKHHQQRLVTVLGAPTPLGGAYPGVLGLRPILPWQPQLWSRPHTFLNIPLRRSVKPYLSSAHTLYLPLGPHLHLQVKANAVYVRMCRPPRQPQNAPPPRPGANACPACAAVSALPLPASRVPPQAADPPSSQPQSSVAALLAIPGGGSRPAGLLPSASLN